MLGLSHNWAFVSAFLWKKKRFKLMKTAIFYRADAICIEVYSGFWQARCSSLAISVLSKSARLEDCVLYRRVLSQHALPAAVLSGLPRTLVQVVHCTVQRAPVSAHFPSSHVPTSTVTCLEEETPLSSVLPSSCQCLTTHRQGLRPLQLFFPRSF